MMKKRVKSSWSAGSRTDVRPDLLAAQIQDGDGSAIRQLRRRLPNDIGLITVIRNDEIIGYNVIVGGGMGTSPSAKKTSPMLAKRMAFAKPEQVIDVCKAILMVQRDHGNREDRKVARMKYLVDNWGIDKFRKTVEEYFGGPLADCTEDDVHGFDDHMGWQEQGDGLWSYGLNIENGPPV